MTTAELMSATATVERITVLVGSFGTAITAGMAAKLGDVRLTGNHAVLVLCSLALHGRLRPRDIQAATGLTSGGATSQLDRLAGLGLVERSHDLMRDDRRAVVLSLTSEGERVADLIADTIAEYADNIRGFLADIAAALDDPAPAPRSRGSAVGKAVVTVDRVRALELVIGLAQLGTLLRDAMSAGIEPPDLVTNATALVLGDVAAHGPRRPRDLARLTGISSGGTTKLLERLATHGLVYLDHGGLEADRRATLVSLAPRGRRALVAIAARLAARRGEIRRLIDDVAARLEA